MSNPVRFKTLLRGHVVDVEMKILSMDPPKIAVFFHGRGFRDHLTKEEMAMLCRKAQEQTALQRQHKLNG
jgi:hypothetical protein